jgi:hypothetical protein
VPEVWFWKDGGIRIHVLSGEAYREREASTALPGLDMALLRAFWTIPRRLRP